MTIDVQIERRATTVSSLSGHAADAARRTDAGYRGPERRALPPAPTQWLAFMLDEVDYGALLLTEGGRVALMNHAARADLQGEHPLHVVDGELRVRDLQQAGVLHQALLAAHAGQHCLITLGNGATAVSVTVKPLGPVGLGGAGAIVLMLGKRQVCAPLSVQLFARRYALTPSETRVLEGLCEGLKPRSVAAHCNVALTTVRTHIGAIRAKVGARGIGEVLQRVALLPPVVAALRTGR